MLFFISLRRISYPPNSLQSPSLCLKEFLLSSKNKNKSDILKALLLQGLVLSLHTIMIMLWKRVIFELWYDHIISFCTWQHGAKRDAYMEKYLWTFIKIIGMYFHIFFWESQTTLRLRWICIHVFNNFVHVVISFVVLYSKKEQDHLNSIF